jgi:hypothetical protein
MDLESLDNFTSAKLSSRDHNEVRESRQVIYREAGRKEGR